MCSEPKKRSNDIGVMWCGGLWGGGGGVKSGKPPSSPLTNHICSKTKASSSSFNQTCHKCYSLLSKLPFVESDGQCLDAKDPVGRRCNILQYIWRLLIVPLVPL